MPVHGMLDPTDKISKTISVHNRNKEHEENIHIDVHVYPAKLITTDSLKFLGFVHRVTNEYWQAMRPDTSGQHLPYSIYTGQFFESEEAAIDYLLTMEAESRVNNND